MFSHKIVVCVYALLLASTSILCAQRPKVGLVLSGGGAKGFAHIGVIKVLEEVGVPIDYIGGTSMGGIVGGLYAIGYSSAELEQIVTNQDWNTVLSDKVNREELSIFEKERDGRFFLTFPVYDFKVKLPSGMVEGHNITKAMANLTWPVHHINDFSKFPIPFLCVAADIASGESVTLDKGYLPDAMRASMSIPSAFSPVEIDGKLLVDGGLVNNLPVQEVLDAGADIIISVDVQSPIYKKSELNTVVRIVQQASKFLRRPLNEKNRGLSDLLICPDMKGLNGSDFSRADSLIVRGEQRARAMIPQIMQLMADNGMAADTLTRMGLGHIKQDSLYVQSVVLEGKKKVSYQMVYGKLDLTTPGYLSQTAIEQGIDRLFGSQSFTRVSYKILPTDSGNLLYIRMKEKETDNFDVGLHYDSDIRASILLSTTVRNFWKKGSVLSLDLGLSEHPKMRAAYFIDKGWRPGLNVELEASENEIAFFTGKDSSTELVYRELTLSVGGHSVFYNSYILGGGIQMELSSIRGALGVNSFDQVGNRFLNYYGFLKFDTYNTSSFPTNGMKFQASAKFITDIDDTAHLDASNLTQPYFNMKLRFGQAINWGSKITVHPYVYAGLGYNFGEQDSVPASYEFFLGGVSELDLKGVMPFYGTRLMEQHGRNVIAARMDLQYEVAKDHYLTARYNIGRVFNSTKQLSEDIGLGLEHGFGLSYGYRSIVGPIEITLMSSTYRKQPQIYTSLGFWF